MDSMTNSTSIAALAQQLEAELILAYPAGPGAVDGGNEQTATALRDAFTGFGRESVVAGISLEDAMAASIDTLQGLFERFGGHMGDPTTMRAAGIALAAVSRGYRTTAESPAGMNGNPPMPTQLSRLAALHKVNRAITAHLELNDMLETTVRIVTETMASDGAAVFLYDDATSSLALRSAVGLHPASVGAFTIRPGVGVTGRAASELRPVVAVAGGDLSGLPGGPQLGDEMYASQLAVPLQLHAKNTLVGVLTIFNVHRRRFEPEEITFLQSVASELAISVENGRLYGQTDVRLRRKVEELGTLQRVSRTVASSLDLDDVLRLIAEQSVELVGAEAAAIFRVRPPSSDDDQSDTRIEYFAGDQRGVINDRRDVLVREVVASGSAQSIDIDYADGQGTLFCLPLRSAREMYGALCIRMTPDVEITEDHLGLLQAFTDSASLAIENAQLYQQARHSLDTVSALLQEMHHRVRNNLQTVAALLSLQLRANVDAPWSGIIREAISRVQAIAAVHDLLSDEKRLSGTTVDVIARHVADEAHVTMIPPGLSVDFEILPGNVRVPSRQATIVALIINELITNAVSHGFKGRTTGRVSIRTWKHAGFVTLEVANNGRSVPRNFEPWQSTGLGMRIIGRLVQSDLHGEFTLASPGESGTIARVTFPLVEEDEVEDILHPATRRSS